MTSRMTRAQELDDHWEKTFQKGDIDEGMLEAWLQQVKAESSYRPLEGRESLWRVRRADVAWAVRTAKCSAPGPDGFTAMH